MRAENCHRRRRSGNSPARACARRAVHRGRRRPRRALRRRRGAVYAYDASARGQDRRGRARRRHRRRRADREARRSAELRERAARPAAAAASSSTAREQALPPHRRARAGHAPTSTRWSTRRCARSRDGNVLARTWRELTGGEVDADIEPRGDLLERRGPPARPPGRRATIERKPRDAGVDVRGRRRRAVREAAYGVAHGRGATCASADRARAARSPTRTTASSTRDVKQGRSRRSRPARLAEKYPTLITIDRGELHAAALQAPEAGQGRTGSPSARSASRRRPGSTTSRTRRSTRRGASRTPPGRATSPGTVVPGGDAAEPAQGALDGDLQRRRHPRHRRGAARSARTPRTAASGCSSRTSSSSTTRCPVGAPVYIA